MVDKKTSTVVEGGKYGVDWQKSTTLNGVPLDLARSAVLKEARRGKEVEAVYWALELAKLGELVQRELWRDMAAFAFEDAALADPQALAVVRDAKWAFDLLDPCDRRRTFVIGYVITYLCRAKKARYAMELFDYVTHLEEHGVEKPKIPDYAYDFHFPAGREKGRDLEHFLTVGAALANKHTSFPTFYKDKVLERARKK